VNVAAARMGTSASQRGASESTAPTVVSSDLTYSVGRVRYGTVLGTGSWVLAWVLAWVLVLSRWSALVCTVHAARCRLQAARTSYVVQTFVSVSVVESNWQCGVGPSTHNDDPPPERRPCLSP
jgi:hypothetical protein